MIFSIIFLIFVLILLIWQISLIVAVVGGAPTVYAKNEAIKKSFDLAGLKRGQTVVDLGCGNARSLVIAAKNYGAKGIGVEISPFYYLLAKLNVALHAQSKNIKIHFGNINQLSTPRVDSWLAEADLIYLYLFPKLLAKIEPWLFTRVKPPAKIVSVAFGFKNHKPIKITQNPKIYIYKIRKILPYSGV